MNVLKRFNSSRSIYNRSLNVPKKTDQDTGAQKSYLAKSPNNNSVDTMLYALEAAENRGFAVLFPAPPALNPSYVVSGYVQEGYVEELV